MKRFIAISILATTTALQPLATLAQSDDPFAAPPPLPADLPPMEAMPEDPFEAMPALPMDPMTAQTPPLPASEIAAPGLPAINDQENFDFFQQGAQLPPLPGGLPPLPEALDTPESDLSPVAVVKPAPAKNPHERPLKRRFDYKNQTLSERIYRPAYTAENRHLPLAQTQASYDQATFAAAASNNLDGLRAMLEHGGRSRDMRNERGETLADVAYRFRAFDTLHYLTAIGVPRAQRQSALPQGSTHLAMQAPR